MRSRFTCQEGFMPNYLL
jgi:hypothetical protein